MKLNQELRALARTATADRRRTQLAIATMNECRSYKLACTEQPYVRAQQEKVQHSYMQEELESLEILYCEKGRKINNKITTKIRQVNNITQKKESNKVITAIEYSKTHYKGNSVICTMPNDVISRLYTICLLYTSPSPRD